MDSILGSMALMATWRQSLGRWGEAQAEKFLLAQGYSLIEKNWRTGYGEIDLIVKDEATLVFVEVKTRTTSTYGYPEKSITPKKQEHLIAAAQAYLQENPHLILDWRIDVVAIRKLSESSVPEIIHFENAIS